MSIQVLTVLVSVLLRTCIKVLSEHIRCIECHYLLTEFNFLGLTLSLSLSLPLCIFIPCVLYVLCFYPAESVVLCSASAYDLLHGIRARGLEHPLLPTRAFNTAKT